MIVTIVHVFVKPGFEEHFIAATRLNHEASVKEPENLRFDVLRDEQNPSKFVLYEAYASEDAVKNHKDTAHYLLWRDTVAPWMEQPRQGLRHQMLFP